MVRSVTEAEILEQIRAARAYDKWARKHEPHAAKAHYDPDRRTLQVDLTNGCGFSVPIEIIPSLRKASPHDIAEVEVIPPGIGLEWERLDVQVSILGIMQAAFGPKALLRAAGAAGGSVRSAAKAAAARRNGRKGGRPPSQGARSR
ncbi:MAG: DUF2442 domain-containing protein [Gemmatimonadetes bacterium]|nr:DUF2442 domain-containing protein [Gemmatimonadota bacterium]